MNTNNTPNHRNCIPSPPTFAGSVDGNFHAIPWLGDLFDLGEHMCMAHPLNIPYMDNPKVKADQLTQKVKAGQLTWCGSQG